MGNGRNEDFGLFGLLMKFCTERGHAEELLDGILRCNRVSWFRDLGDPNRGDKHEGSRLMEDGELSIRDDETGQWHPLDTVGPVRFNHPAVDNLALFCTSLVRSERHEYLCQEMVDEFMRQLEASLPTFVSMGAHAVVIRDMQELFRRVDAATKREGYTFRAKPVSYYDSYPLQLLLKPDDSIEPAFHKHESYRLQREHRFAIKTDWEDTDAVRLDIGRYPRYRHVHEDRYTAGPATVQDSLREPMTNEEPREDRAHGSTSASGWPAASALVHARHRSRDR